MLGVTCPDLNVEFGEIVPAVNNSSGPPFRFGDMVKVVCEDGFHAVNDTISCMPSGLWDNNAVCEGTAV